MGAGYDRYGEAVADDPAIFGEIRDRRCTLARTIDRHPLTSVGSLVLGLRCTWCGGDVPGVADALAAAARARIRQLEASGDLTPIRITGKSDAGKVYFRRSDIESFVND